MIPVTVFFFFFFLGGGGGGTYYTDRIQSCYTYNTNNTYSVHNTNSW